MRVLAAMLCLAVAGCDAMPRDSWGALEKARERGALRVGVAERAPWVGFEGATPSGPEPAMVRAWANKLGLKVQWVRGSEPELAEALHAHDLDVVIAGLERKTTLKGKLALSQPYLKTELRAGAPQAAPRPEDLKHKKVAVAPERLALISKLRKAGATTVTEGSAPLFAGYDVELQARGLRPVAEPLGSEQRVIAVSQGESRLLFELDRFLKEPGEQAWRRLAVAELQ